MLHPGKVMSIQDLLNDMKGEMESGESTLPGYSLSPPAEMDALPPTGSEDQADPIVPKPQADIAIQEGMHGLDVMEKVAGDVLPQATGPVKLINLVDGDVDAVIPVIKQKDTTMSLSSVYTFRGILEIGNNLNSKQKCGVIHAYQRGIDVGFVDQPLSYFQNWFSKLQFANAILEPNDGKKHIWYYRNILLKASAQSNLAFGSSPLKYFTCARRFSNGVFHSSESMDQQIGRAVEHDITLMVVAVRLPQNNPIPKHFSDFSESLKTLAAVSFQMFPDPKNSENMSVFLSLLGVAHHTTAHPPSIPSWRRNGLGLFMLIQVIKRCASVQRIKNIEVFLQCSEPSALHFYSMIGFWQINKVEADNGFALLPEHVQTGLEAQPVSPFLKFVKDRKSVV